MMQERLWTKDEVIALTDYTDYRVSQISEKYNIGILDGKYRMYNKDDIKKLEIRYYLRRHEEAIIKVYGLIAKHPYITHFNLLRLSKYDDETLERTIRELSFKTRLFEQSNADYVVDMEGFTEERYSDNIYGINYMLNVSNFEEHLINRCVSNGIDKDYFY